MDNRRKQRGRCEEREGRGEEEHMGKERVSELK